MRFYRSVALALSFATVAFAAETTEPVDNDTIADKSEPVKPVDGESQASAEYLIPNSPILKPTNIITIRAIGLGVSKAGAINRAQEMALAKRAAILDGYRQLGEKLHGIKISGRDSVKDSVLLRSEIRAEVRSIVRGAEVIETIWDNDLCQVEMEVKIDGRRWYKVLAGL
ncbi:MAG: hypothetical protein LBQ52_04815 [Helicobacteraceae bacterium]|jgi:hypothetical protein|nr:hypothetical protein [Helicobacteraceae bacterium]